MAERIVLQQITLFSQFDRASGKREKERLSLEIIHSATEENFDCISVLKAVDQGFRLIVGGKDKQYGVSIIQGISQYFEDRGIGFKLLLPDSQQDTNPLQTAETFQQPNLPLSSNYVQRSLDEGNKLCENILKRQKIAEAKKTELPASLSNIITSIKSALTSTYLTPETAEAIYVPIFAHPTIPFRQLIADLQIKQVIDTYENILRICKKRQLTTSDSDLETQMKIPEKVVETAEGHPVEPNVGLPDVWNDKFGGFSLQDLATTPSSGEEFGKMVLKYATAVPKGDALWHNLINALFVSGFYPRPNTDGTAFFSNPPFSEKILLFQSWIADKLFLPAFYPDKQDEEFDTYFAQFIDRLTAKDILYLSFNIFFAETRSFLISPMFHPDIDQPALVSRFPLLGLISDRYEQDNPGYPFNLSIVLVDQLLQNIISQNIKIISANFAERFSGKQKRCRIKDLEAVIYKLFYPDYVSSHTEEFVSEMEKSLGANFLDLLNTRRPELEKVTESYWQNTLGRREYAYRSSPLSVDAYAFSPGSFPEYAGFESVLFYTPDDFGKPVIFNLRTKNPLMAISGKLSLEGKIADLSAVLDQTHPGLQSLIEHFVVGAYHDLVWREQIVRTAPPKPSSDRTPQEDGATSKGKDEAKQNRQRTRGTPLPRTGVVFEAPTERPIAVKTTSSDTEAVIVDDMKKRKIPPPITVVVHKRAIEGARRYRNTVIKYNQSPEEEKPAILIELDEARRSLKKPSTDKISHLPPGYELEIISDPIETDPETGEIRRYTLETWVISYTRPRPTEEERRSPKLMYEKYYRQGPASIFLNYLKTWIVESQSAVIEEK